MAPSGPTLPAEAPPQSKTSQWSISTATARRAIFKRERGRVPILLPPRSTDHFDCEAIMTPLSWRLILPKVFCAHLEYRYAYQTIEASCSAGSCRQPAGNNAGSTHHHLRKHRARIRSRPGGGPERDHVGSVARRSLSIRHAQYRARKFGGRHNLQRHDNQRTHEHHDHQPRPRPNRSR